MLTIGITGGTGFLGTYMLRRLANEGTYRLRALSRTMRPDMGSGLPGVSWMQGDLASERVCRDFVQELDVIIHLAHTNTPLTSDHHLPSDANLNLVPTLTLLEAIRSAKTRPHLIYASSGGAVYGRSIDRNPLSETDCCKPCSSYGIQKLAAEHYIRTAAEKGWVFGSCLRIANPYGVLLPPERKQGIIGVMLNQLAHNQPITVFGNRSNIRDYIHLDDLYDVITHMLARKTTFNIFNIGSGVGHSVDDIIRMLEELHGNSLRITDLSSMAEAYDLLPWVVLDIRKIADYLGWTPKISFREGFHRLYRQSVLGDSP